MRKTFRTILKYYLKFLAKLVLLRYRPRVIAVAGSINKGFVKDEVARAIAASGFSVRAGKKNFNTDIGLPLAILDLPSGYGSYQAWLRFLPRLLKSVKQESFPKYLVLDFGVSDPGDMSYLLSIVRPNIVIITDITQRYLEGFEGMDHLVGEYECLAKRLRSGDVLIYNMDNRRIAEIAKKTKARTVSFGIEEGADYRIGKTSKTLKGQTCAVVDKNGNTKELTIDKFGFHNIQAAVIGEIIATRVLR